MQVPQFKANITTVQKATQRSNAQLQNEQAFIAHIANNNPFAGFSATFPLEVYNNILRLIGDHNYVKYVNFFDKTIELKVALKTTVAPSSTTLKSLVSINTVADWGRLAEERYNPDSKPLAIYEALDKKGAPVKRDGLPVFVLTLAGTQGAPTLENILEGDPDNPNDWASALISGCGQRGEYEEYIKQQLISFMKENNLTPSQFHLDMVGHSQGGILAQLIAQRKAEGDPFWSQFNIDNITTFGAPPPTGPLPLNTKIYNYVDPNDIINIATPKGVRALVKQLFPNFMADLVDSYDLSKEGSVEALLNMCRDIYSDIKDNQNFGDYVLDSLALKNKIENHVNTMLDKGYLKKEDVDRFKQGLLEAAKNNILGPIIAPATSIVEILEGKEAANRINKEYNTVSYTKDKIESFKNDPDGFLREVVKIGYTGTGEYATQSGSNYYRYEVDSEPNTAENEENPKNVHEDYFTDAGLKELSGYPAPDVEYSQLYLKKEYSKHN